MNRFPLPSLLIVGVLTLAPAVGYCQTCDEPLADALIPASKCTPPMMSKLPKAPLPSPNKPLPSPLQPLQVELSRVTKLVQVRMAELHELEARIESAKAELEKLEKRASAKTPRCESRRVGEIILIGSEATGNNVILRQIPLLPGQVLTYPQVEVKPAVKEPDAEYKDILIQVQQCPTGGLLFGLGCNSDAGCQGSIVVNERNFDCKPCVLFEYLTGQAFRRPAKPCWLEMLVTRCAEAVRMPMQFCEPEEIDRGTEEASEAAEVAVPPAVEKRLRELEKKVELVEAMQAELAALREQVRAMQPPMVPYVPDVDTLIPHPIPLRTPPVPMQMPEPLPMPKVVPEFQHPSEKIPPSREGPTFGIWDSGGMTFGISDSSDESPRGAHPLDWLFQQPTGLWVCD